jgi:hypothetical protein
VKDKNIDYMEDTHVEVGPSGNLDRVERAVRCHDVREGGQPLAGYDSRTPTEVPARHMDKTKEHLTCRALRESTDVAQLNEAVDISGPYRRN